MANASEPKVDSSKSNKTIIAGIAIIIILLIVVVVLLLTRGNNQGKEVNEESKRGVVVTEDNVEEVVKDMVDAQGEETEPSQVAYYSVTMNYEWKFPTGNAPSSNAYVENNTNNVTDVYFDVFLADDETEAIYESPIIPVGEHIRDFSLSKDLDPGTYQCICVYHLVDENQITLSTLRVKVTVIVEQ